MEEHEIESVANILNSWNPLGSTAANMEDLDGYRVAAIDIIFQLHLDPRLDIDRLLISVMHDNYDLELTTTDCTEPARKIAQFLNSAVPA